jgi:hypothetical protein
VSLGKNTVKARNSVESWLGQVESAMVSSLRRLAKQGMASYVEEPREDWVLQQPAQLVIAVSQVYWCAAVEEALRSDTAVQKLAEAHEVGVLWPSTCLAPCYNTLCTKRLQRTYVCARCSKSDFKALVVH